VRTEGVSGSSHESDIDQNFSGDEPEFEGVSGLITKEY
jgi:hypothetical protein